MFTNLNVFRMAQAMAVHAGQRQAIVAQNVANADTPGYRAQELTPFAQSYQGRETAENMRGSRARHLNAGSDGKPGLTEIITKTDTDPNGNSVSVELEMVKAAEIKHQHDRAITIYKSSLTIMRASLGRS